MLQPYCKVLTSHVLPTFTLPNHTDLGLLLPIVPVFGGALVPFPRTVGSLPLPHFKVGLFENEGIDLYHLHPSNHHFVATFPGNIGPGAQL